MYFNFVPGTGFEAESGCYDLFVIMAGVFIPRKEVQRKRLDERYEVGNDGTIYSEGGAMVPINGVGVNIHGERKKIAYLVARAWVPNPEGRPYVIHKNGYVSDNRACNLEWSEKEEVRKRGPKPKARYCAAFTREGDRVGVWRSASEAAEELGLNAVVVRRALAGRQKTAGGYLWRWGA